MEDLLQLITTTIDLGHPIDAETPLISAGFIDSFDVVTLLAAIESRYNVAIPPEEIGIETFDTPVDILARIQSLRR